MFEAKQLDDLAKGLADILPDNIKELRTDLEQNFRSTLQSGLTKLDLVSREEFDAQTAVLQRTRERLEALEKQVIALEKHQTNPTAK